MPLLTGFYTKLLSLGGFERVSGHLLWTAHINEGWNLLDCGSNRGIFLERVLSTQPLPARVICVEANPVLAEKLEESPNTLVTVVNAAVSAGPQETVVDFCISDNCEASSIYTSVANKYGTKTIIRVPAVSLGELIERFECQSRIVVKMDIEGAELDVLENCSTAELKRICQLTVEFHDNLDPDMQPRVQRIVRQLEHNGFIALRGDAPGNQDVLFIARDETAGITDGIKITFVKLICLLRGFLRPTFSRS